MAEKDKIVVLADVSGSMADTDGGSRERKSRFALLVQALSGLPKTVRILLFSDGVSEVRAENVRLIGGGTALHLAIIAAAAHSPIRTVIISDGEPDSEPLARAAIERLSGIVDVVYCGSPSNTHARNFLESLARAGAGGFYQTGDQMDVSKQLPAVIAGLLKA